MAVCSVYQNGRSSTVFFSFSSANWARRVDLREVKFCVLKTLLHGNLEKMLKFEVLQG